MCLWRSGEKGVCCVLVVTLEHWKNWNTGTLEQLEHWNTGTTGTLEHWNNRDNKKVVVDSVVKIYGGCGLCREEVW